MNNLVNEAEHVMTFLEKRGLSPEEACDVMGLAITCIIADQNTANSFLRALKSQLRRSAKQGANSGKYETLSK
jgi:hypothetical protein